MASVVPLIIHPNNDMTLSLTAADANTLSALNSGIVVVSLYTVPASAPISGQSWPTELSYVSGSSGVYRGVLTDSLDVTAGQRLRALLVFSGANANEHAEWELDVVVRRRTN